jgi:hypothetical protein
MKKGELMTGANKRGDRVEADFYPTPTPGVVLRSLFAVWKPKALFVWEPACGAGALSRVMNDEGYAVFSSDLRDYGYGTDKVDFFKVRTPPAPCLITNPPWNLARKWVEHAKDIGIEQMALLLPTGFFTSLAGGECFDHWRPRYVLPLTWRLDFQDKGSPVMTSQWVVWDLHEALTPTEYKLLRKAKGHDRNFL